VPGASARTIPWGSALIKRPLMAVFDARAKTVGWPVLGILADAAAAQRVQ
jgi:hypothetical protein